ncbi:tRNA glutamyl-Q(34) synthetase GluQRS [Alteromonas sp. AMM-1]|uniref:tRNA glutamyl-Q(34) synthetase GluQRS n=1 Tax=Alteromonas sp. AMM-1 TaxID=3394233 RepID=UPI0039A4D7C3
MQDFLSPISTNSSQNGYVGRFAPSPTGPLHFGSLLAALASYLDARANNGRWILRMEDIDQPRCVDGADQLIMQALLAHGLQWDGDVWYQSARLPVYQAVIQRLTAQQQVYGCVCTRKQIRAQGGVYPGTCRTAGHSTAGHAVRLQCNSIVTSFSDAILGQICVTEPHALEDTLLQRSDGIYSYNLVVVVDDIAQGVTHIVRGSDLLDTTAAHLTLYKILDAKAPAYAHIPVAATAKGRKLSKQNHARALDLATPEDNLLRALAFLGLSSVKGDTVSDILDAATANWQYGNVPKMQEVIVDEAESTYHTGRNN